MKALTLQEPFATLVANGTKYVENRSWSPFRRNGIQPGDRIAIHRGGKDGAIIATAVVADVVPPVVALAVLPSQEEYIGGPLCWVLTHIRKLRNPIPCKGRLGLWDAPPGVPGAGRIRKVKKQPKTRFE
jgi:hypothetical protein